MSDGDIGDDQRPVKGHSEDRLSQPKLPASGMAEEAGGMAAVRGNIAGRKTSRHSSWSASLRGRSIDHRFLGLFYGVTPDGRVETVWAEDGHDNIRLSKFDRTGVHCHFVPPRREPLLLDRLCNEVRYAFGFDLVEAVRPQQVGTRAQEVVRERLWLAASTRWRPWNQTDIAAE